MTTPEYGDDYVAQRLSIDVPTQSIQGVRELTEAVERYRTTLEAATRAEADITRYIDQMAEAQKRAAESQYNLNQHLSVFASLSARVGGGGATGGVAGVPYGTFQQPFQGTTAGMGGTPGTPPGARMPNPSDVAYQLQQMPGVSQRGYLNFQAQRGGVPPGTVIAPESISALADKIAEREKALGAQAGKTGPPGQPKAPPAHHTAGADPYDQFQQRAGAATGLASSVMNEIGAGQGLGFGNLALQGINYARKRLGAGGGGGGKGGPPSTDENGEPTESSDPDGGQGGMSGLAKGMGAAGGILTSALAAFGLIQKGGAMVQGWRNIASARGGAGGEGFDVSMHARGLAMDPMISTDQARQVYQALLSEGYTDASGNGGDNVRDLMVQAIKDWNMSIPEFVAASRMTQKFTEMSTQAFGGYMSEMRNLSKTGWQSQQDIQRRVIGNASQLVAQGVSPNIAMQDAMGANQIFASDPVLAGGITSNTTSQTGFYERMYGGAGGGPIPGLEGLDPEMIGPYLNESGQGTEAKMNVYMTLAKRAQAARRDYTAKPIKGSPQDKARWNAWNLFFKLAKPASAGDPAVADFNSARHLYDQLIWGGQSVQDIIKDADKRQDDATSEQRKTIEEQPGYGGSPGTSGRWRPNAKVYGNQILDRVLGAYGGDASQIEVMTPNGAQQLDVSNKDQIDKLGSGEYKWRHRGDTGPGITMSRTPDDMGSGFSTDTPNESGRAGAETSGVAGTGKFNSGKAGGLQGQMQIGLTDEAKKLLTVMGPNPVPLTPNDVAANSGQGTAQVNNPPPGNAPIGIWGH